MTARNPGSSSTNKTWGTSDTNANILTAQGQNTKRGDKDPLDEADTRCEQTCVRASTVPGPRRRPRKRSAHGSPDSIDHESVRSRRRKPSHHLQLDFRRES